jgi:hypothetical protein
MSVFSPDVNIDSPLPLPIDGGNPNPVLITGAVSLTGSTDGLALDSSIQTLITDITNGTQHTLVDNFPASQAVTGTFWQATQPVSIATMPTTPVTGTFWQAIQPVSGTVAVSNFPATVAVTQSTSPWVVSGTITANLGTIDGAATAANQATELTDLTSIIANQTNGTQHTIVDNFPADADALAQGSTTAGQLGALIMGAVTTAAPTYVTGKTDPLSIDTAGNLRVVMSNPAATLTSSSDTVTQITSTAANQTLLALNLNRKKAILFFESGIWNVKFGAVASATSKTYMVASSNTTIEVPIWVGQIDAICTTSGKLVDVTEMV